MAAKGATGGRRRGRCSQHPLHLVPRHGPLVVNANARGKFTKSVKENGTAPEDKVERHLRKITRIEATRGRWSPGRISVL